MNSLTLASSCDTYVSKFNFKNSPIFKSLKQIEINYGIFLNKLQITLIALNLYFYVA